MTDMITLRNQITFAKAEEIARENGHAAICSQDYLLACVRLKNPGLEYVFSPGKISEESMMIFN